MKTSTNIKPAASLSSSLLARKGEAMPAVAATIHNNPGLAWGEHRHADEKEIRRTKRVDTTRAPSVLTARKHTTKVSVKKTPTKQKGDSIALIFNIEDEHYMRLKYQRR